METKVVVVVVVCAVAALLGLLSAVLGFAAEATKVKSCKIIPDAENNVCVYPSSPASALGLTSALILLVAFIMVNLASRCFCCYRRHDEYPPPSTSRPVCNSALFHFILSWIFFVMAFIQMLVAARLSTKANMDKLRTSSIGSVSLYSCNYVKPGVFATAAGFAFTSVSFGIACCLNLTCGKGGPSAGHIPRSRR